MDILLDTNIIVIYSRDNELSQRIEDKYQIFNRENRLFISVVTLGEIDALIKKSKLGARRKNKIKEILSRIYQLSIEQQEIITRYGDIDNFSQVNKAFSSRNMGKNDLWIAATASRFNIQLITADKDFNHLKDEFIDLLYIDLEQLKNDNI